MVTKIAKKGLEYLKKNQGRRIESKEFLEYLKKQFNLETQEVDPYLQEMKWNDWIFYTDPNKNVYLSQEGENLLEKLSKWSKVIRNATSIVSILTIIFLIVSLIVSFNQMNSTIDQFRSERAYQIGQESSELKIIESTIESTGYQVNWYGKNVTITEFTIHVSVVNSITARYPAKIISINNISYILENSSDGRVALDLGEEDEILTSSAVLDWEEPYTKLVYPGEVYSEIRLSTKVLMYGNYTLVIMPDIEYYDPFTGEIKNCNNTWLYKIPIEGEQRGLEQNKIIK